ncbi:FecR family protein [Mucilaginibacter mallensis]|uniref:FecR family protein n=1 Tax=Mucilaginibacter mallensis TaxID=652787 RepID=A0A1H1ZHY5_MUCMA|nr:FecR family protein [Mucilaginibacter mallensis]SDT33167.1 FecR family protein [Mucilaginibacter mallensis]
MSVQLTKEFLELKKKYLNCTASPDEIQLLEQYYDLFADEANAIDEMTESEIAELEEYLKKSITQRIIAKEKPVIPFHKRNLIRAAAILVFFSIGIWLLYNRQSQQVASNKPITHDVAPGGNKAILTLSNGAKVVLNNVKNGDLATQAGAQVIKQDSLLSYKATAAKVSQVSYNTITTPNGGQFQMVLADGTKVWLNAASSLKFPTEFIGKDRTVELTGEAYFEVAKNKNKPFNVKTATQTVQVLGTHFNINSYNDEAAVKTTLLEGSVKVFSAAEAVMISPGQQAILTNNEPFLVKNDLDVDEVIAWKNGMFQFNEADIQTIMRQISRWYDIDVEFKGPIPNYTYHGKISRNSNASEVLKILGLSGINFTIEGRRIIVKS